MPSKLALKSIEDFIAVSVRHLKANALHTKSNTYSIEKLPNWNYKDD